MRKAPAVVCLLFLFAGLAAAQIPTSGNVFIGYSYLNSGLSSVGGVTSSLGRANINGWEASVEGKIFPFVGIVADFSSHYGTQNFQQIIVCPVSVVPCGPATLSSNVAEHFYLFGPRVGVSVGKLRPFAQVLFGAAHVNATSAGSDTSFATAVGGGLDYRLIPHLAWRLQGDYVRSSLFDSHQNNVRISTGVAVRF